MVDGFWFRLGLDEGREKEKKKEKELGRPKRSSRTKTT
jgi:hypothetical protein